MTIENVQQTATFEPTRQAHDAVMAAARAGAELVGREMDPARELTPLLGQLAELVKQSRGMAEQVNDHVGQLGDHPALAVIDGEGPDSPITAVEWLSGDLTAAADHLSAATAALLQARLAAQVLHLEGEGVGR